MSLSPDMVMGAMQRGASIRKRRLPANGGSR
jgi:hypothetical protein